MYKIQYICRENEREYLQPVLNRRHTNHSYRLCRDFTLRSLSTSHSLPWDMPITSSVPFAALGEKMATTQLELVTLNTCSTYTVYCPYTSMLLIVPCWRCHPVLSPWQVWPIYLMRTRVVHIAFLNTGV